MTATDSANERLARIEATQIAMLSELRRFCELQDEHNKLFYQTRDKVLKQEAGLGGAWTTIGIFGSLTVAVSSAVAWAVSVFHK